MLHAGTYRHYFCWYYTFTRDNAVVSAISVYFLTIITVTAAWIELNVLVIPLRSITDCWTSVFYFYMAMNRRLCFLLHWLLFSQSCSCSLVPPLHDHVENFIFHLILFAFLQCMPRWYGESVLLEIIIFLYHTLFW